MNTGLKKDVILADHTTIGSGGKAEYFLSCSSGAEIKDALKLAAENKLRIQVISGGSNIIFPDNGFDGLVIKIDLNGIDFTEDEEYFGIRVSAGENWDDFVKLTVGSGLPGIECLSGIPGSAGATPIQNVGAYGQEVSDTIHSLNAIDRNTFETISFYNKDCKFGYRTSRFKAEDKDKYIITEVTFRFQKNVMPEIKYPELQKYIESNSDFYADAKKTTAQKLSIIRESVLTLRKGKSMVIDKDDPNSKSCGSFFVNPVLSEKEFQIFKTKLTSLQGNFPYYKSGNTYKIPAAWLVELSGFNKGYVKGGAGISENHSLAIINKGGTTLDVLNLAEEIERKVSERFGITLVKEPVIVL